MTVALSYTDGKHAYIIADSCASDALNQSLVKNPKVFNPVGRKDVLIGCAGTFRLPNLLKYVPNVFPPESEIATEDIDMSYLVNEFTPVMKALTEDFGDDDLWEMLIAVGNRIYRMQMDLSIIEPADCCESIGCGGSVALGAFKVLNELEPEMSIEERMSHALKVACDTVQGCAAPFSIMKTEDIPEETLKLIPNERKRAMGYEIVRSSGDSELEIELKETPKKKKSTTQKKKKS